jgi:hypothetical protein
MNDQVHKYNTLIQQLLDQLGSDLPANTDVDTIKRRFRVAISIDRTFIIEETSSELLKYREYIHNGNIDTLISKKWEDRLRDDKELISNIDNNSLRDMISMLRSVWSQYSEDDRAHICKMLKRLLNHCIKYYQAKKDGVP